MSKFIDHVNGFHVYGMCKAVSDALQKDGYSIDWEKVKDLLNQTELDNKLHTSCEYMPISAMWLVYASWMCAIADELNIPDQDEFALSWAPTDSNINVIGWEITKCVVDLLDEASEAYRQQKGYSPIETFIESVNHDITPEEAAAKLELERTNPTIN